MARKADLETVEAELKVAKAKIARLEAKLSTTSMKKMQKKTAPKKARRLTKPKKLSLKQAVSRGALKLQRHTKHNHISKRETKEDTAKLKAKRRVSEQERSKRRKDRGLYVKDGFVKLDTPVLKKSVTGIKLAKDTLFEESCCVMREAPVEYFDELRAIENKYKALLEQQYSRPGRRLPAVEGLQYLESQLDYLEAQTVSGDGRLAWHRYGGNRGISLAMSIAPSGTTSRGGFSGSIQEAAWVKRHPELAKRAQQCIAKILDASFGKVRWYRQAKAYCKRLNEQAGNEERTVWNTCFSGLWLTLDTKEGSVHKDHNVVGPAFLLSTYEPRFRDEGALAVSSPTTNYKWPLKPGTVIGGNWAQHEHCNINVDAVTAANRTSWVVYLDKRVFGKNYVFRP